MRRSVLLASLTATLLGIVGPASAGPAASLDVQVMTQNQYIGANLFPLIPAIATGDPAIINSAVVGVIGTISANRTVDRVNALAKEILIRKPHLLGLQEVWNIACEPANAAPCTNPEFAGAWGDHLAITEAALGSAYRKAAYIENFAVGLPFQDSRGNLGVASVLDRDVIFVRSDVPFKRVVPGQDYPCAIKFLAGDGCTFNTNYPLPPLGPNAYILHGFEMVDATVGGKDYRFVNTHLENGYMDGFVGVVQSLQAVQVIEALAATPANKRLILVGDMNSAPNDAKDPASPLDTPYMLFAGAGLFDSWLYRPGNVAGLTCCQAEDLMNRSSLLTRRIDFMLTREMPRIVKDARLIGEVAADRLGPPGRSLWPSDHASVAAWWQY